MRVTARGGPFETRCDERRGQTESVSERTAAVTAAKLPIAPARDDVGLKAEHDRRGGNESPRPAARDEGADDGEQQQRRPEEQPLLRAEENGGQLRRSERESIVQQLIRVHNPRSGRPLVEHELWQQNTNPDDRGERKRRTTLPEHANAPTHVAQRRDSV